MQIGSRQLSGADVGREKRALAKGEDEARGIGRGKLAEKGGR